MPQQVQGAWDARPARLPGEPAARAEQPRAAAASDVQEQRQAEPDAALQPAAQGGRQEALPPEAQRLAAQQDAAVHPAAAP